MMNFFETIGFITVLYFAFAFISEALSEKQLTDLQNTERRLKEEALASERRELKAKYETWKMENPEWVEELARQDERVRIHNQKVRNEQAVINDLQKKFFAAKPEEKEQLLDKLKELSPNKWGKVWLETQKIKEKASKTAAISKICKGNFDSSETGSKN